MGKIEEKIARLPPTVQAIVKKGGGGKIFIEDKNGRLRLAMLYLSEQKTFIKAFPLRNSDVITFDFERGIAIIINYIAKGFKVSAFANNYNARLLTKESQIDFAIQKLFNGAKISIFGGELKC